MSLKSYFNEWCNFAHSGCQRMSFEYFNYPVNLGHWLWVKVSERNKPVCTHSRVNPENYIAIYRSDMQIRCSIYANKKSDVFCTVHPNTERGFLHHKQKPCDTWKPGSFEWSIVGLFVMHDDRRGLKYDLGSINYYQLN